MEQKSSFPELHSLMGATASNSLADGHPANANTAIPSPMSAVSASSHHDLSIANDPNIIDFDVSASSDLDLLWENLEFHPEPMDYTMFSSGFPFNPEAFGHYGIPDQSAPSHTQDALLCSVEEPSDELSWQDTYASRLPSLQPNQDEDISAGPTPLSSQAHSDMESHTARKFLYVSREAYNRIRGLVDAEKHHLPPRFRLPSRHALCRYVEGFSGFQAHVPFLHLPTIDFMQMPLELTLAISAIGAQFRFERHESYALTQAAKCIINLRLELDDASSCASTPQPTRIASTGIFSAGPQSVSDHDSYHTETEETPSRVQRQQPLDIRTLQAMIIVTSICTYNHHDFLPHAFVLAGQMAHHLRNGSYLGVDANLITNDWHEWVRVEGRRRTVLTAFLFLNIHTVIYNIPPRLMNSEIWSVHIPQPETHWQASTSREWAEARRQDAPINVTFGDSYSDLFASGLPQSRDYETSAFGNLLIMHGILQQIHLAKEAFMGLDITFREQSGSQLPDDIARRFKSALQRWQHKWTMNKESSTRPNSPVGPLGFNSTAFFRVACLRVDFNIGSYWKFETRDAAVIADAFKQAPRPPRSQRLYAAVLQSAHALSIPVRLGIQYVAKTQTLTWSIIHSLCNLECALFLSKWLENLAMEDQTPLKEEERLLCIIAGILQETPFFETSSPLPFSGAVIRRMSAAIIRLVAELSTGVHVSEFMDSFEEAVKQYASYLENAVELEQ